MTPAPVAAVKNTKSVVVLDPSMPWPDRARWLLVWLGLPLILILIWDLTAADLWVAHWFGSAQGFALADNYWLSHILHTRARQMGVLLGLFFVIAIWWPIGPLRQSTRRERIWLACMVWVCATGIAAIKAASYTSCPSDLQEFGGIARYIWHFAAQPDGGPGRCFPSGHASTFFSFLPVFWLLQRHKARHAWFILAGLCLAGLALSFVQVLRGAHFPSHILWTAWLCWATSALASPWLASSTSELTPAGQ